MCFAVAERPLPCKVEVATPAPAMGATSGAAAVGQKVSWKGNPGTVRFVGKVSFAAEEMAGIELDGPQVASNRVAEPDASLILAEFASAADFKTSRKSKF